MLRIVLPGDYLKTLFYLYLIKLPRKVVRDMIMSFYRYDHIYDVIREFRADYSGEFTILELGVANGTTFTKLLYATRFLKMSDRITVHGFDTFEGMPPAEAADKGLVGNDGWVEGQFSASYEALDRYCRERYSNYGLHKGLFSDTLTDEFLRELEARPPILIWMDADYYSSTMSALERLAPHIPTGCVVYFDEPEFNFGSRFTGESKAIHEINSGALSDSIELVPDRKLSQDSQRVYRFINCNATNVYRKARNFIAQGVRRPHSTDSPLP